MVRSRLASGRVEANGHIVVLMHDIMFRASRGDRTKLGQFIDALSADGHSFAFISEYVGVSGG